MQKATTRLVSPHIFDCHASSISSRKSANLYFGSVVPFLGASLHAMTHIFEDDGRWDAICARWLLK